MVDVRDVQLKEMVTWEKLDKKKYSPPKNDF